MNTLLNLDTEFLLFLNSFHNEYFDWFMSFVTRREIWLPMYLAIIYQIYKRNGNVALLTLLFVFMVPAIADLLNQHIFKPNFDRLRPFHVEEIKNQLHVFNENPRGRHSFMSGHAMNSFGLATFCSLLFRNKTFSLFIFLWALLITYSRIYLGFHYPGDSIAGSLVGIGIGYGLYYLYKIIIHKYPRFHLLQNSSYNTKPIILVGIVILFCIVAAAYHNLIFIEEFIRRFSKLKI